MSGSDSVTPVKLGCGSLILIAFIVAMFTRAGTEDLEDDVTQLRGTVEELQAAIELQTDEIRDLNERIDSLLTLGSR